MSGVIYNTNLSKAQGLIPETFELLALWEPGMTPIQLKSQVQSTGALGKATETRVNDIVTRGFAQRYLIEGGKPAAWLKRMLADQVSRSALRQIILIFTARHNPVLHDFLTSTYWSKVFAGSGEITKADTREFLERAASEGRIQPRWADSIMERVTRYLLGTLEDFQMIEENRTGRRLTRPLTIHPETVRFLAHDLHFRGIDDRDLPAHPDWGLFGLMPADVIAHLEKEAARGHMQVQNAGQILRIEWKYSDMDHTLDAIAH
ncbi:MAG: putative inner rane protein [Chthoniobacteraceae bacterium]|nr:putative inner rane protein [Chthoniobacteraceae bacterium]